MNKNLFRIIFNKRRGQLMAVAETSSSQGKGSRGEATASDHPAISDSATVAVGTLSFAVLCSLGAVLWALPTPSAHAQVVAYRNVPGSQQPSVLQTANGVPQVNIQTPSAAGVSRNAYSQFDVQSNGAILNNSKDNVKTQLGGWIQANPWLATGSARVILNEVNSSNPSYLNGYVEVAGQRAEVVIANPSGISVNGGGFINTSKATLTTGTPIVNGGSLDGYRVQGGNISINGNGLDLRTTDYAAILARAVQVNAGIWANELKVVTGANQIDAASLAANTTPLTTTIAGTGAVPSFALDVAQIGGMYAGKIHLIGTEQGLGVRSVGTIDSMGGDLVLQNTGWLSNTGELQASANLQITAQGDITNSGTLYASNDQTLIATGSTSNSGVIAAQGNICITANSLSSSTKSVIGAGIKTDGTLVANGNLNVTTTQGLAAKGQTLASGNIALTGRSVDLSSSQTGAANIAITANSGNVNTANATVATSGAAGVLAITAKTNNDQTLDNTQGVLSAVQLNLDVANLTNAQGQITQTGVGDTSIALTSPFSTFSNTGGTVTVNSTNLNLSADTLTNTDGKIQHAGAGTLHVTANTLNDQRGQIVSNNALALDAEAVDHRAASTVAKNITLNATSLNNTAGTLTSNGNLTLDAQSLTNNQGKLSALGDLTVTLDTTRTTGSPQNAGTLSNLQGFVAAKGSVTITAASVDNSLGIFASVDKNLSITTTGITTNDSGKIQAALDITLINAGLSNTRTANDLATSTTPYGSVIGRNIDINTNTQTLNNAGGTIAASQKANLQTGALNNDGGLIQTDGHLTIHTHGQTLTNTNAANYTSSNTALNGKGGIASQGTNTLTTSDLRNDAGYIGSKGTMTANSANISNTQNGQIQGLGNLSLTASNGSSTGTINNTGGLIRSAATTSLSAATVTNSNTSGTALGVEGLDVSMSTTTLRNDSGAIRADNNISVTSAGTVNNSAGLMSAGNTLTLQDVQAQASRTLANTNTNGTLLAGQSLAVAANSIGGDGSILSKGNLNLALNADFANSGQVIANRNATINTGGNVSNSGKVQAGNTLSLKANKIDNVATGEISANTTQVIGSSTLANRGLIDGTDTQINANTVNNIGTGRIYGDHLSIAAVNLTNDTENLAGVTKAGTIASRDRLDLGISGTLTNREHALIYSVGDMAMGGALDANRRATGSANTVNNKSATIEAGRNLSLSSATVNNTNDHFAYEIRVAATELNVREDIESGLYRVFTRTTYLPYQTASDPAQILAAGDINLTSSNAINFASHIVAGGALNIGSSTLANTDVMATKSIRDVGTTYTLVHVPGSGSCGKISINCVHAHDIWQTGPYDSTANRTVSVAQVTASSSSGAKVTSLASATVNQMLGVVGSADTRSDNITQANVSAQQIGVVPGNAANGASTPSSAFAGQATTQTLSVRGAHPNTTLPTSSLYKNSPSPNSAYLIETDTRFIDRKIWLGSDYMTQSLSLDATVTQKRLGDGFYEQKLIREQVAALTGRRFLADYTSDEQEFKALMSSAITFGQKYNLRPGIALSAQQIAQLTSDIVWLVEQTVSLPDGSTQKVLVPQVYVKVQPGDLDGSGALLSGKDVDLKLSGDLTNSGAIAGRNVVSLTAENVNNLGGRIGGNDVNVAARQDLNNIGGSIGAVNSLSATAGRDLNIQTTTQSTNTQVGSANFSRTGVDRVAGLYVSGANGTLVASADRDLNIVAGVVSNAGSGTTSLSAGNNFTLASVKTGEQNSITWNADNHLNYGNTQAVGSTVNGGGNVNLKADNDLTATAANVQAAKALGVQAGGSVNILAGENTTNLDEAHKTSSGGGFFGGSTLVTRNISNTSTAVASNFGGGTVDITANSKDINVKGANVFSDNGTNLTAGGNVNIEAATNTSQQSNYSKQTDTGFLSGGGGLSISYGTRTQSNDGKDAITTAAASTVGSVGGNVNITAGNQYSQVGSDVLTPMGDVNIQGKTVHIQEARETSKQSTEQKFEQTSISVGLKGGIIDSVQAATQAVEAAKDSSSNRNRNLNALIAYAKGSDAYEQGKAVEKAYNAEDPSAAAGASGIKLSVSIGTSESQSNSSTTSDTAAGSTVKAAGNVNIKATGQAETEGNLTIQGSNVSAAKDVSLSATKDVNILASSDAESNRSTNSSSSTSVGVSVGISQGGAGLSLDIAANRGKGQANSDSTTYNSSHVSAGNAVNITSGADTNVVGGNIKATQVTADVGGNLNVQSLQDKAVSEASQKNTGIALSIPIVGKGGSASFSQSKQNNNSNYASVNEQSGIQAGDGGFQVTVKGNTDLKGATIASSDKATQDGKNILTTNTLTTSDINNSMSASASSSGVSVGTNMMDGKYAMAKAIAGNALNNGSANQRDASATTSAISAGNITVGSNTTDTSKVTLTDSNGKTVSTDTSNTNRTLAKADVAGLQKTAQDQQAGNMLVLQAAVAFTDQAFNASFLDQTKMYKKVPVTDDKGNTTIQWQEMTLEEKAKIPPGSRIANNGIFNGGPNDPKAAQDLATQNSSDAADYLVHFPQANTLVAELLVAGYQKFLENGTTGLTNATQQNVDLIKQTGGNITLDGHSRGGMTVGNALTAVQEQGGAGGKTNVNLFGSAYNAQNAANTVNQMTNGTGEVKQSTNNYDFVGRILGGNAGTGGTLPPGSSVLEEVIRTMGGNSTVHNNYGQGQDQKGIDDYWGGVKPVLQPVAPTNVLPTLPTGEGK